MSSPRSHNENTTGPASLMQKLPCASRRVVNIMHTQQTQCAIATGLHDNLRIGHGNNASVNYYIA